MNQQNKMAAEMAKIRPLIAAEIGCTVCASGIAIDAVGERYGYAAFEDWRCQKPECSIRANGVPADKLEAVHAAIASLPPVEGDAVAPAPVETGDSRLPVERDDEQEAPL